MQEAVIPNQPTVATPPADAIIRAEKIEKYYAQPSENRIQVIAATDLSIVPGEILALLGPSGSGKSTMLRMLTGLSTPTAGQVYWHEKPISEVEINVSIVFQSFALFPWLTVLENVEAPLQARGVSPEERRERSMKMLDTVGLDGFEAAYPKELSGGMKQRVGFARALVVEPEVLFMDEPFSALDVLTAENLRSELLELWANKTMPTKAVFIVTHNIEEAVLLADRIIVLGRNPGHIRTDFRVQLPQPRDRKSEPFTNLVDYIYKVLTKPDVAPARPPTSKPAPRSATSARCTTRCCPTPAPAAWPASLNCSSTRADATTSTASPTTWPLKSTTCSPSSMPPSSSASSKSRKATPPSPQRRRVRQLRNSPPEGTLPRRRRRKRPPPAPDSSRPRIQKRPLRPRRLLPRHARRAVQ